MNWQIIKYEDMENGKDIKIQHYSTLHKLGARLHRHPKIASWEFRLAYFEVGFQKIRACEYVKEIVLKIFIPFMKYDRAIILRVCRE